MTEEILVHVWDGVSTHLQEPAFCYMEARLKRISSFPKSNYTFELFCGHLEMYTDMRHDEMGGLCKLDYTVPEGVEGKPFDLAQQEQLRIAVQPVM